MKIATNVHRDAFGGITISNLALFDWLEEKEDTIVGIEFIVSRHLQAALIFRRYLPSFFAHHIINAIDVVNRYPWERAGNPSRRWRVLIDTAKDVLRRESPDVVLVNGTYFAPWILAQAARELGIPIVLRYAGVLKREVAHLPFLARRRLLVHERWLAGAADAVIFPSALCRRVVEEEVLGRPVASGIVIPNPAAPRPTRRRARDGRFTIAAIGRWSHIKNFQAFLALHRALRDARWPHRAILVTSYWDKHFGIPETVERKDPMSQEELRAFYRTVDLLVVPSLFETFCNVAAEALVHGTPVLVSRQVGFAETLQRAGLGRMVVDSFDDPAEMVRAVKRVARAGLTERERKAVVALLDPHRVHDDILRVLQQVVEGPRA